MVMYNMLFLGRLVESLILQFHIYKFFFKRSFSDIRKFKDLCIKGLTREKRITFVILSIYMLAHCLSIPALGIALEIRTGTGSNCKPYVYEYHTVYWILDIFRYIYDVAVRLFMVLATLAVGSIWSEDKEESMLTEGTTQSDHDPPPEEPPEREDAVEEPSDPPGTQSDPPPPEEPKTYSDYLKDRQIVSLDHTERWEDYTQRGNRAKCILEVFQVWFILPWLLYFISSSLNTDYILRSWKEDMSSDGHFEFSKMVYMVYSFNQLFLLSLPYVCSRTMNAYHHDYIFNSRKQQMESQKTASRMALAYLNKIEQEEHFNFVPHLGGTSIQILVGNPLYTIFLLVGFLFTVVETLI